MTAWGWLVVGLVVVGVGSFSAGRLLGRWWAERTPQGLDVFFRCPVCRRLNRRDARYCPHCGDQG